MPKTHKIPQHHGIKEADTELDSSEKGSVQFSLTLIELTPVAEMNKSITKFVVTVVLLMSTLTWEAGYCSSLERHRDERSVDVTTSYWGPKPRDCAEVQQQGNTESGIYHVFVGPHLKPIRVFCDLEHQGGGWLVFQRREDGFEDFQRNWGDYAKGFGDLFGEFWLGNHFLHLITQQKVYRLRVDLEDFDNNTRYAEYSKMTVEAPFKKYRLHVGNYTGDAGDGMAHHSGQAFSTAERDNDNHSNNCAVAYKGGWWYGYCHDANPNGVYHGGPHTSQADGVNWEHWRGNLYSLKSTVLELRPANFEA